MRLSRIFVSLSAAALAACSQQESSVDSAPSHAATAATGSAPSIEPLRLLRYNDVLKETGRFTRFENAPHKVSAHEDFCERYPAECNVSPWQDTYLPVSKTLMETLKAVNIDVNRRMVAMHDNDNYGGDFWTIPPEDEFGKMRGDCDDYTMTKRSILSNLIPKTAMSVAFVQIFKDGVHTQNHAVLVVRTLGGELVLDNLTDELKTPQETGYKFVAMTEPRDQRQWRRVSLLNSNDARDLSYDYKLALMKSAPFRPPFKEGRSDTDVDINILTVLGNGPDYQRIRQNMNLDAPQLLVMAQ